LQKFVSLVSFRAAFSRIHCSRRLSLGLLSECPSGSQTEWMSLTSACPGRPAFKFPAPPTSTTVSSLQFSLWLWVWMGILIFLEVSKPLAGIRLKCPGAVSNHPSHIRQSWDLCTCVPCPKPEFQCFCSKFHFMWNATEDPVPESSSDR
jgi:hypothetical protein